MCLDIMRISGSAYLPKILLHLIRSVLVCLELDWSLPLGLSDELADVADRILDVGVDLEVGCRYWSSDYVSCLVKLRLQQKQSGMGQLTWKVN